MTEDFDLLREQHQFNQQRFLILAISMILAYLIIWVKMFDIVVLKHDFWREKAQKRFVVQQQKPGHRKDILDKNGFLLATMTKTFSIGWQPFYYDHICPEHLATLSTLLDLDEDSMINSLKTSKKFIFLKRKLVLNQDSFLKLKQIPGISLHPEDKRFYPLQEITAHLLGFVNIDNKGVEGIEASFDQFLISKKIGRKKTKDLKGRTLFFDFIQEEEKRFLRLSLDSRLQSLIYKEMKNDYHTHNLNSFSSILIDVETSSVLAVGSYPSFNPNDILEYTSACRLKPFLDSYEPGSVLKPFSVACVLATNQESLSFKTKTAPGYLMLDGHKIIDVTKRDELTLSDILIYSSNIGLTKLLIDYPACQLDSCLKRFGFDQQTGVELLNEVHPDYPQRIKKGSFVEATFAFGYGLQVNLGQIAQAYTVFADNGFLKPISLLYHEDRPEGLQVLDEEIALTVKNILRLVVESGSAKNAYLKDYPMAGKTGTVKRVGKKGYEDRYHAFFAVIFPVEHPRYVLVLHADDPQGKIYGGQICAPIAKRLVPKILALSDRPTYTIGNPGYEKTG
jgi:cell division protein FtsI (penicillin-binding protein 3)